MRYQIDTRNLEEEKSVNIFRALFRWAAARGDYFEITCQTGMYDDPRQIERLRTLGESDRPQVFGGALTRWFARKFDQDSILIRGRPNSNFISEVTENVAPERAISGHECPVESIVIYRGKQDLYVTYDYGTVQIVELAEPEKMEITREFAGLGLDAERLRPLKEDGRL